MVRSKLLTLLAAAGLAGFVFPAASARAAEAEVILQGLRFVPAEITVHTGETVNWVHRDSSYKHHVTADDGSFDSHPLCGRPPGICMTGGDRFAHTYGRAGTYGYYCRLHGHPGRGMAGLVTVVDG